MAGRIYHSHLGGGEEICVWVRERAYVWLMSQVIRLSITDEGTLTQLWCWCNWRLKRCLVYVVHNHANRSDAGLISRYVLLWFKHEKTGWKPTLCYNELFCGYYIERVTCGAERWCWLWLCNPVLIGRHLAGWMEGAEACCRLTRWSALLAAHNDSGLNTIWICLKWTKFTVTRLYCRLLTKLYRFTCSLRCRVATFNKSDCKKA